MNSTTGAAELPEALPRYREYMHLRTTGAWSDGVPAWAKDYSGRMNDMTAAHAVIEELHAQVAARAAAPQPPADVVRVCPECDIAGCRHMRATPAVAQEPWYGHQFKEVQRGVWRCTCGKQLKEQLCTNGTPNTSLLPPDAAKQGATQMRGDGSPGPKALVSSIQAESSHDTHPAPQQAVPAVAADAARESEYLRGYRQGYEQRDAEVRGSLV
mgnify:CR=1 FL=1